MPLQLFKADLHVHTVVSPCAAIEMIPPFIIQQAQQQAITLIAITDHNTTANVEAVQKAAIGSGITVLPGMELQTREEVHLLALFDTLQQMNAWQTLVSGWMPPLQNNIEFFGEQFVVNETGDFIRREPQLLLTSATIELEEAVAHILALGGLAIPAHINRKTFSLLTNLGFVPPNVPFDALELSRHLSPAQACQKYPYLARYPLIQNGDVHMLDQFLGATTFQLAAPTITEIRLALHRQHGHDFNVNGV